MSGLAASFGEIGADEKNEMLGRLEHRAGPQKVSVAVGGNWIGSRYAAATSTTQPVMSDGDTLAMVIDGEIYGTTKGDDVPSMTDVVNRFESSGATSLNVLDGAFAMVVANKDGRMSAARDRLGLKPLYWARRDGVVRFASTIGAFSVDWLPSVEFFPPGHVWDSKTGLERFASDIREESPDLDVHMDGDHYPDDLLTQIQEQLVGRVRQQLRDGKPVVSFLSGGLDSSLIAAIAHRTMMERGTPLKTYAVGLAGAPDLLAAREVADYLGTDHTEIVYTVDEALAEVPEVVRALENFDPSLVRSSVANYILSSHVARHADIVLSGEGADELFAGYRYLRDFDSPESLDRELRALIAGLHQGGLQRVDRTTMAHGLQARMPFLSLGMIDLAMSIPAWLKRANEAHPEKQLLRESFRGWLPDEILWRKKAQFGDGSGAADALTQEISSRLTDADLEDRKDAVDPALRTLEELAYYEIFSGALPGAKAESLIGRFVTAYRSVQGESIGKVVQACVAWTASWWYPIVSR